jgi:hypothetical protein
MDVREKLVELIIKSGEICYSHTAEELASHLIDQGVTVQEWISVKERLPEKDIRVLVWMKDNEEGYTQMDTDRWGCTMEQGYHWIRWGKNVTHWMPLPQPPKGE